MRSDRVGLSPSMRSEVGSGAAPSPGASEADVSAHEAAAVASERHAAAAARAHRLGHQLAQGERELLLLLHLLRRIGEPRLRLQGLEPAGHQYREEQREDRDGDQHLEQREAACAAERPAPHGAGCGRAEARRSALPRAHLRVARDDALADQRRRRARRGR